MFRRGIALLVLVLAGFAAPKPLSAAEAVARDIRTSIVRIDTSKGGTGTGFVIDGAGFIATNDHVVRKDEHSIFSTVVVTFRTSEGETIRVEGEVWGSDPMADIAVVKVDPGLEKLRPFTTGEGGSRRLNALRWASAVPIGAEVFAIGFPFGQAGMPSVTRGIISAVDRTLPFDDEVSGLVQTDAAINPGNSGGPLVNAQGEVVGVNTFGHDTLPYYKPLKVPVKDEQGHPVVIRDASGKDVKLYVEVPHRRRISQGIHYARGYDTARPVVEEIVRTHRVVRGSLGFRAVTEEVMQFQGEEPVLEINGSEGGARIVAIEENSPASKAGLKVGDVVERILINGRERAVHSIGDLNDILIGNHSGARVKVILRRSEKVELVEFALN